VGIFQTDDRGRFLFVNERWCRITGLSQEDAGVEAWLATLVPEDRTRVEDEWRTAILEKRGFAFEGRLRHRDGGIRWVTGTAVPLPGADAAMVGHLGTITDVTDRRRGEDAERAMVETHLQMRIAREIQQGLLPTTPPLLDGFDVAGLSRLAEAVGGDYYDFLPMPAGRLALVIADAVGHGIGPALLMAQVRASLWSLVASDCRGIEEILRRANHVLHAGMPYNRFVTAALVLLDPTCRTIRACSCGHPPGYLLDCSGLVKARLESTGYPLGCMPECDATAGPEIPLAAGDTLLLLTDGVTEAESPAGETFGEHRVLDAVRAHRHESAARIVEAIEQAVHDFRGSHPEQDDATSVVLKVLRA
jgi:sigma-B regulation protein RsbU (phosphoserine phosphatase)